MNTLQRRLEKLEASCPTDAMERAKAIVRNMSIEEIRAESRACMLKRGFDPSLPFDEALDRYIEIREAEIITLSIADQEYSRQYLALIKQGGTDRLRVLFPELPRQTTEVRHV